MSFPKWYEKDGVKKLFSEEPAEKGWEECAGHYDFALGVWVEPKKAAKASKEPRKAEHEPDDVMAALRVEYGARAGKRPFNGWNEAKLREKIAALKNAG